MQKSEVAALPSVGVGVKNAAEAVADNNQGAGGGGRAAHRPWIYAPALVTKLRQNQLAQGAAWRVPRCDGMKRPPQKRMANVHKPEEIEEARGPRMCLSEDGPTINGVEGVAVVHLKRYPW